MICQFCGTDTVAWCGPLTNLTHTRCSQCGSENCQEVELPAEPESTEVPE
jgi:hypothetical protein